MTQIQGIGKESLVKYPHIFSLGEEENEGILNELVVVESKIDGGQFRGRYVPEQSKLIYGSRNNILSDDANINDWIAIRAYKKAFEDYKENFIPDVIYYSENMKKHTIQYDNISETVGYDILDLNNMKFYPWRDAKKAFEAIGIPFIHVHFEKHGKDIAIEELNELIKQSPYREQGKPDEGLVIKCYEKTNKYGRPLFAKIVTKEFKEQNRAVFGESGQPKKQRPENEVKIADRYLNDARFNKAILYFIDINESIGMSLMPKLYKYVINDILSEYIISISNDYNSINFPMLTKIIAARCAQMLKSYLLTKSK